MSEKSYLNEIQLDPKYQIMMRECSDKAAQGLLTLLVTVNVGAFITVIEVLKTHEWLLILFTISTLSALFSRTGIYYIYRHELDMFEHQNDKERLQKLERSRLDWWRYTEISAWSSLISFTFGIMLLTVIFIFK